MLQKQKKQKMRHSLCLSGPDNISKSSSWTWTSSPSMSFVVDSSFKHLFQVSRSVPLCPSQWAPTAFTTQNILLSSLPSSMIIRYDRRLHDLIDTRRYKQNLITILLLLVRMTTNNNKEQNAFLLSLCTKYKLINKQQ